MCVHGTEGTTFYVFHWIWWKKIKIAPTSRHKNVLKMRGPPGFDSPSYTPRGRLHQTLVASDFQERWAQRAASHPPGTPGQTRTAQAAGPTHRRSLKSQACFTDSLQFLSGLSISLSVDSSPEVICKLGSHLAAGFHQAVWSWAGCSCISFSPSAPPSPSWPWCAA